MPSYFNRRQQKVHVYAALTSAHSYTCVTNYPAVQPPINPPIVSISPSDNHLRTAAFEWISRQVQIRGEDVLPAAMLKSGFKFQDHKIFFISQLGILRPRGFDVPLTIRTGLNSPYDDQMSDDGFLIYDYEVVSQKVCLAHPFAQA